MNFMGELITRMDRLVDAYWPVLLATYIAVHVVRIALRTRDAMLRRKRREAVRRSWPLERRWIALYGWYDERGRLLYVGVSKDPGRRAGQHFWRSPWSRDASQMKILDWFTSRQKAYEAEIQAIKRLRPIHNTEHNETPRLVRHTTAADPVEPSPRSAPDTPLPVPGLTADEARQQFRVLLAEFIAEGVTDVMMADIMTRWPHRSQPWISRELQRLEAAGTVERLPSGRFVPATWRVRAN